MSDTLTSSTSLLSYIDDRIAMPAELYLYIGRAHWACRVQVS